MNLADLADLAARQVPRQNGSSTQYVRPLPRLGILRHHRRTSFEAAIYEPVIILILQGRKETVLGADTFAMATGECLLVSHDLPVIVSQGTIPTRLGTVRGGTGTAQRPPHRSQREARVRDPQDQARGVAEPRPS